jgi:hypothetical protein
MQMQKKINAAIEMIFEYAISHDYDALKQIYELQADCMSEFTDEECTELRGKSTEELFRLALPGIDGSLSARNLDPWNSDIDEEYVQYKWARIAQLTPM